MHPFVHARTRPSHPAIVVAETGEGVTYQELDARSNRAAHLFHSLGIRRGDGVAVAMENNPRYFDLVWGAQRSGLYFTPISIHLLPDEIAHIVYDSGARLLLTSYETRDLAAKLRDVLKGVALFMTDGVIEGFESWDERTSALPTTPIADESSGTPMLYSSGTTGRPKGVRHPLPEQGIEWSALIEQARDLQGMGETTVYLSPAPLYHAGPTGWTMVAQRCGATVVITKKFDAEGTLRLIERLRVTHAQFVPTHFVRLLKLPAEVRAKYDLSSLRYVFHAAAPCPITVKEQIIDWWGPVIYEIYGGSEANGSTYIGPEEWLGHKGSVGRGIGCTVHICDDDGNELPVGSDGLVYFGGGQAFEYHNDPDKTASSRHRQGWSTLGDVGHVDDEGYLYLTDRKHFTIVSGGVNIYPQEIENLLITHPRVADVAVIGVPDEDLGEKVLAVIEPTRFEDCDDAFRAELLAICRGGLGRLKVPKAFEFAEKLPRHPNGKLYKKQVQDEYRARFTARQ